MSDNPPIRRRQPIRKREATAPVEATSAEATVIVTVHEATGPLEYDEATSPGPVVASLEETLTPLTGISFATEATPKRPAYEATEEFKDLEERIGPFPTGALAGGPELPQVKDCPRGHEATYRLMPDGKWRCKECKRLRQLELRNGRKSEAT